MLQEKEKKENSLTWWRIPILSVPLLEINCLYAPCPPLDPRSCFPSKRTFIYLQTTLTCPFIYTQTTLICPPLLSATIFTIQVSKSLLTVHGSSLKIHFKIILKSLMRDLSQRVVSADIVFYFLVFDNKSVLFT
jgi:hypothetical protein